MKIWRLLRNKSPINIHQIAPTQTSSRKEAARKYRQTNSLHALLALRLFFCCFFSLTLKPTWLKRAKLKLAKGNRAQPPVTTADPHQQPAKEKNGAFGNESLQQQQQQRAREGGKREGKAGQDCLLLGKCSFFCVRTKGGINEKYRCVALGSVVF